MGIPHMFGNAGLSQKSKFTEVYFQINNFQCQNEYVHSGIQMINLEPIFLKTLF